MQKKTYKSINLACTCKRNSQPATLLFYLIINLKTFENENIREYKTSHMVRPFLTCCPIIIGSGYRSPASNKAVGGVANSQHMTGEAADIHIPDEATGKRWFVWLMDNVPFHQLIWEKSTPSSTHHWIHVAFKRTGINKQQVIHNLIKYPSK